MSRQHSRRDRHLPHGCPAQWDRRKGRCAFTLVELLVVIGIIAVLISMLLPALSRARESAQSAKCLSNLRQLAMATMGYCNYNKGFFPGQGDKNNATKDAWIFWSEVVANDENPADPQYSDNSALAPYLGAKGEVLKTFFRCGSDDYERRSTVLYRYSYSLNQILTLPNKYTTAPWSIDPSIKRFKLSQVRNSSEKIMFVEEDSTTIDDGVWNPFIVDPSVVPLVFYSRGPSVTTNPNQLADRHETHKDKLYPYGRGNVSFCDGHASLISRLDAGSRAYHDPAYVSGNPVSLTP